jgi:peroxiredoxin
MTIAVGDPLPQAIFLENGVEGIAPVTGKALFAGRRVVLFGVPGAYTGVCSTRHVPSFIRVADALRAKGVDEIACVAVNDPFVMKAWGEATGATTAGIRMLSDAEGTFARAIGLTFDNPDRGLIGRSKRYALLAKDGVVRVLNVEASTGDCALSAGEAMLAAI